MMDDDFFTPFSQQQTNFIHSICLRMQEKEMEAGDVVALFEEGLAERFASGELVKHVVPAAKVRECPACGAPMLPKLFEADGLYLQRCVKQCGYSRVVN